MMLIRAARFMLFLVRRESEQPVYHHRSVGRANKPKGSFRFLKNPAQLATKTRTMRELLRVCHTHLLFFSSSMRKVLQIKNKANSDWPARCSRAILGHVPNDNRQGVVRRRCWPSHWRARARLFAPRTGRDWHCF